MYLLNLAPALARVKFITILYLCLKTRDLVMNASMYYNADHNQFQCNPVPTGAPLGVYDGLHCDACKIISTVS